MLGVERERLRAGDQERPFARLARELHPDVNGHDPEAEEKFKEAAEAYEVLSDAEQRRTYDAYGHEGLRSGGWAPRSAGFGSIEDIFSAFFGSGDPFGFGRRGPAGGGDVGAAVEISLEEVLTGTTREVRFDAVAACEHCRGNGAEPGTPIRTCERCGGAGQLRQVTRTPFGQMVRAVGCDACGGDGKIAETPCGECGGRGRRAAPTRCGGRRARRDRGRPAGADLGAPATPVIRAARRATSTSRYGSRRTTASSATARTWSRSSTCRRPRRCSGTTIGVETLEGRREVEVAAGTQPGSVSSLRGLGLPRLGGGHRGDQRFVFNVIVPTNLSEGQRDQARDLDATLTEENLEDRQGRRLLLAGAAGVRLIRLAVRCRPEQAEPVLAELSVLAPNGVEEERGPGYVEYAIYGAEGELPDLGSIEAAAGDALVAVASTEIPDDWADRWQDFHEPLLIGDRLWLRPSWREPRPGTVDVLVDPGQAFGTGAHPTTRLCLEMLLEAEARGEAVGALTDLGTGSGVLAIAAARLGWAPVEGYDHEVAAVEAAAANAAANGVEIGLARMNLRQQLPPLAATVTANLTAPLLLAVAAAIGASGPPRTLICSGLLPVEQDEVAAAFATARLTEVERRRDGDWAALRLAGGT